MTTAPAMRALDHVEANDARAGCGDGRARLDASSVDDRTDAGHDAAASERGQVERDIAVDRTTADAGTTVCSA